MEKYWYFPVLLTYIVLKCDVIEAQTSVFDISCDFEQDLCGWTSDNLTRTEYATQLTDRSGPRQAQNGAFYVYLDTSRVSRLDTHKGSLERTGVVVPSSSDNVCLRFWYHMFGETMGSLEVFLDDNVVWTKTGNQSDMWHCAIFDITTLQSKLSLVATMGRDIYSIIAIDNINVFNTASPCAQQDCENLQTSTTVKPTSSTSVTSPSTSPTKSIDISTESSDQTNLEEYIPYIAGVPAAILLVGALVLVVCLRSHKTKTSEPIIQTPFENEYNELPRDTGYQTIGNVSEEVYTDIDEAQMIRQTNTRQNVISQYENPLHQNGQIEGNEGGQPYDDYLTPTNRQSASMPPTVGDDDYITPTSNPDEPNRTSANSYTSQNPARANSQTTRIPSVSAEVDSDDYLVLKER
ncbi:neuropilin-1-like [Argopecten irradians]|uniref:neuropilin-1-like n=1 Tax=Argopecten irradians TaxID=31199 RepID=UPI003714C43B